MNEPYFLAFTLKGLPRTTNAINRKHWAVKAKEVKFWHGTVALQVGSRKPPKPLTRARLILTRFSSKRPDYDGLVSSFKHIIDGLVVCGVLEDDNMDVIGMPRFHWIKGPLKGGSISVVVMESDTLHTEQPSL